MGEFLTPFWEAARESILGRIFKRGVFVLGRFKVNIISKMLLICCPGLVGVRRKKSDVCRKLFGEVPFHWKSKPSRF